MRRCALCGRRFDVIEGGVYLVGQGHLDLCHPDDLALPDCYRLVTVYHHAIPDHGPIKTR